MCNLFQISKTACQYCVQIMSFSSSYKNRFKAPIFKSVWLQALGAYSVMQREYALKTTSLYWD